MLAYGIAYEVWLFYLDSFCNLHCKFVLVGVVSVVSTFQKSSLHEVKDQVEHEDFFEL